jgi:DNA-binding MltR family transcriptional regulator
MGDDDPPGEARPAAEPLAHQAPEQVGPTKFGQAVLDRVTAAIYGVAVKAAEEDATKCEIPVEAITAAISEAIGAPDRTAAIVIFALIDDLMIAFLSKHMNPQIRGGLDTLFERNGILSTAHGRITLSAALNWIDKSTYQDLHLLRDIRNKFAHRVALRSFAHDPIRGYIASLSRRADAIYKTEVTEFRPQESLSARELYLLRALSVVDAVCFDFTHLPAARLHRVNPQDMFKGGEFDAVPEGLQNLNRATARFFLQIAGTSETIQTLETDVSG